MTDYEILKKKRPLLMLYADIREAISEWWYVIIRDSKQMWSNYKP